jgi:hypothetical protein
LFPVITLSAALVLALLCWLLALCVKPK